jgi:membrane protein
VNTGSTTGSTTGWSAWRKGLRSRHPVLVRRLDPVLDVWSDLSRVELVDRSLALGAQALLALIPLLMVLGAAMGRVGAEGLDQVQSVMGVPDDDLHQLAGAAPDATASSTLSVVVAVVSATSFSRALQRMYAVAWELPRYRGFRAIRGSVVWLLVWILMLQTTATLVRRTDGIPFSGLTIQMVGTTLIWWWTAHLLLGGRVSWLRLLPGGVATGALLVVLSHLSHVFMPTFVRANLEQFGSLGIVFAVASWLVTFGGVLIVATVLGRFVDGLLEPVRAEESTAWRRLFHRGT